MRRALLTSLNLEIKRYTLVAARTKDHSQEDENDRHSNQETKVILAAVVVHFVHLHIRINKGPHQSYRGDDPVPDPDQDTGNTTLRISFINQWVQARH